MDNIKNIKRIESYSLSDKDIRKVFKPNRINIVEYQNLNNYDHIDDLFKNSDYTFCVMFFPENEQKSYGHWTCILKHENGKYEYFDSYANYKPDSERKWLTDQLIKNLHEENPLLTEFFLRSSILKIIINPYPLQSTRNGVNDCGDHVCCRLLHRDMNLNQYWEMIKQSRMNPDKYVSLFIYKILGK